MAKHKFPDAIHVVFDPNTGVTEGPYFLAYTKLAHAIDEDGPTDIAEYKLVRVRKFRKDTVECK